MRDKQRVTRPKLRRTRPIRNVSHLIEGGRTAQSAARGAGQAAQDIAHAVSLGYRVIGEYLEQGRAFARAMTGQTPPRTAATPLDDRVLRAAGELGAQLLGPRVQPAPRIVLDVRASRAVRTRLDLVGNLQPGAALRVHELRSADNKSKLRDVKVVTSAGEHELAIRIGVPTRQRAGHYRGELVEPSGSTVAHVVVEVLP